jgi:hypothetical protein
MARRLWTWRVPPRKRLAPRRKRRAARCWAPIVSPKCWRPENRSPPPCIIPRATRAAPAALVALDRRRAGASRRDPRGMLRGGRRGVRDIVVVVARWEDEGNGGDGEEREEAFHIGNWFGVADCTGDSAHDMPVDCWFTRSRANANRRAPSPPYELDMKYREQMEGPGFVIAVTSPQAHWCKSSSRRGRFCRASTRRASVVMPERMPHAGPCAMDSSASRSA